MRVLLIGGSGFLGGHLERALLAIGAEVTSLSRSRRAGDPRTESLIVDRRTPGAIEVALDGRRFDFTVDLAAYDAADVEVLLTRPRAVLGPYVLISTGQVYLVTRDARPPYREENDRGPLIPEPALDGADHAGWSYGIGKRRAERALLALVEDRGVRGTILRAPILIGERDVSLRLWGYLERFLDGGPLLLPDAGVRPTRFLDVTDVARVIVGMVQGRIPERAVYNLASPSILPLRDVLDSIARAAGRTPHFVDAPWEEIESAGLTRAVSPLAGRWVSVLDPARAAEEWGFVGTSMEECLPRVVRWHLENRPAHSHPGYAERAREIEVATRIAGVSGR